MNTKSVIIALIAASMLVSGCGEKKRLGPPKKVTDLGMNDVMFIVNGEQYLRRDFEAAKDMRLALLKHRKSLRDEGKLAEAEQRIRDSVLGSAVNTVLMVQECSKNGFEADSNTVRRIKARYASTFGRRGETFEQLREMLAQEKDGKRLLREFDRNFANEVKVESYCEEHFGKDFKLSDEKLDEIAANMAKEDAQATATNRFIYAHATNIWIKAKGGGDFAALADRFSEEEGRRPGGDLGECDANDFAVEKLEDGSNPVWDVVSKLNDGEISDLISTGEGLTIFKCLGHVEKSEGTGRPAIHLARIAFHRALLYPKMDRAELRETVERNMKTKVKGQFFLRLHKEAKFEFPNGVEYFPKRIRHNYRKFAPAEMQPQKKPGNEVKKEEK